MKQKIICLLVLFAFATACGKKLSDQATVSKNGVLSNIAIRLPSNVKHAEPEPAVLKPNAVIVSVPVAGDFYVGSDSFPPEQLGDRIAVIVRGQTEADRMVYFAGGYSVDFGNVVRALDQIRKQKLLKVGLLIDQSASVPGLIRIELMAEPDYNEDLSQFKPNPLILVVQISRDLKVELNRLPIGDTSDVSKLTQKLSEIFQKRKEERAYKPTTETRTDLTEDERLEKTVIVKAARSIPYGQVVKVIDAVKGGRANPIIVQIDDLNE